MISLKNNQKNKQLGLSLVELMTVLAIIGIMVNMSLPALQDMIRNNRQVTFTNEVVSSLYLARSEAAKRGFNVGLCASNASLTACNNSADDYAEGWIIFTDYDNNGQLSASTTLFDSNGDGVADSAESILWSSGANRQFYLKSQSPSMKRCILYRSNGQTAPVRNFSLFVHEHGADDPVARIYIAITGRIRSCSLKKGNTTC